MATTTTDQVAVDLYAAAAVIRERGWTTGHFEDKRGRVCVRGAIHCAVSGDPCSFSLRAEQARRMRNAENAVRGHLEEDPDFDRSHELISYWNDKRCESGDEAAELLERVAAERVGDDR